MISKQMTCDKCGKRITNDKGCYNESYALRDSSAKIVLWGIGEPRSSGGQRIDLCEDCYESFVQWLESEAYESITMEKPITNFDRIKAMSVDEMAEFIARIQVNEGNADGLPDDFCTVEKLSPGLKQWLESEVMDDA